jgi:hypothetical protein
MVELKEIVRPRKENIAASLILYILGSIVPNLVFSVESFYSYGIPLPIYRISAVAESMPPQPLYEFWIPGIILNGLFWYLTGCYLVEKYRTKGDTNE